METMRPPQCPADEVLIEFADGSLGELPTLLVVEHLRRCVRCQVRVGQHVAVARWLDVQVRQEAGAPAGASDGLARAVARAAGAAPEATPWFAWWRHAGRVMEAAATGTWRVGRRGAGAVVRVAVGVVAWQSGRARRQTGRTRRSGGTAPYPSGAWWLHYTGAAVRGTGKLVGWLRRAGGKRQWAPA